MNVKKVAILGSTGSIGINALNVIRSFPEKFKVVALTAYGNGKLLERQVREFSPKYTAIGKKSLGYLQRRLNKGKTELYNAEEDISAIVQKSDVDIVILGIRGSAALLPFLRAVQKGKIVAPANKEALVMAGHIIMAQAKRNNATIIPVDSEQSAIFQCLKAGRREELKKVYLTASGGPLYQTPKKDFDRMSIGRILKHPRWKMGRKITVDSATLMNKGLEIIEAKWLFGLDVAKEIEVLIHPQAVIHSMVEFKDGSVLAQLGITDMRLPIQYALSYPERWANGLPGMDFLGVKSLTFEKPDFKKFPALKLCTMAGIKGGTLPCVLNAANEVAVEAFLKEKIKFSKIYQIVEKIVLRHQSNHNPALAEICKADAWARAEAERLISR